MDSLYYAADTTQAYPVATVRWMVQSPPPAPPWWRSPWITPAVAFLLIALFAVWLWRKRTETIQMPPDPNAFHFHDEGY